jgi:phage tail sheath protein FI
MLYIENNIETVLVNFVFENNTTRTRARVFSLIDPFLSQVKAAGGLTDYELVVDETNNTPDIIDANQMNVDCYLQPSRTAEYINMRTIITRTGVSFETVNIA